MSILIIDNYDSFTFNLYQLVSVVSGASALVKRNDEINMTEILALCPQKIILSPGPGHPANPRDFGVCRELIERSSELRVPVLGVCLGHQGIVHYLGGKVVPAETAVHGKMSKIRIKAESPLFCGLESGFMAMRYHSLVADLQTLPDTLELVAELESQEALIMSVQNKDRRLFGVQFHPESVGTPFGKKLLENFLSLC